METKKGQLEELEKERETVEDSLKESQQELEGLVKKVEELERSGEDQSEFEGLKREIEEK